MLTIKNNVKNFLEISISGKLKSEDFNELKKISDTLIKEKGKIRVLIDASEFEGWENKDAAEKHFSFVKNHHNKIERISLVAGYEWQHWLAVFAQIFVHPTLKVFDKNQIEDARKWLNE